ncbi:MAG: hypothetical protein J2P14_17580 [Acidothermales bacterium]|nr:hypothetical protein [Acidothermales bacterium]
MARLLYMAITSLDGYVADENGLYDWAMPDDEVSASSTTSSGPSARTCTDAGSTRR